MSQSQQQAPAQPGGPMYCTTCALWSTALPKCYWCDGKLVCDVPQPKAPAKGKAA